MQVGQYELCNGSDSANTTVLLQSIFCMSFFPVYFD